jgi:hypothetical protein
MSIGSFDQIKKVWIDDSPVVEMKNMAYKDSTLQGLDAWTVDGESFFPQAVFGQNPEAWNGTPVVYCSDHPDMTLFNKDPEAALHAVSGRVVGSVKNARIEDGRLKATVDIQDADCENMQKNGRLGISTGFFASKKDGVVTANVRPQHVLVFPLLGAARQRDSAAKIN